MPEIHKPVSNRVVVAMSNLEGVKESDWCAIRVRPRAEKSVFTALDSKGYESFLPLYRTKVQWSDRVKETEMPLFSGYVFCRADLAGKPLLLGTPNVLGILSFGRQIAIVSQAEIQTLKSVMRSGLPAEPWPFLREGQRVRITKGFLADTEGILIRTKSNCRLVLSVEALGQSIVVEVDRDWILPVSNHPLVYTAC